MISNNEKPATMVGLAVGSINSFVEHLFDGKCDYSNPISFLDTALALTQDIHQDRENFAYRMTALKELEPDLTGPMSQRIDKALRPIGAKIAPQLSTNQALVWRQATLMALSDLPVDVAMVGLQKAIHKPMKFLSDVETKVRSEAKETIYRMNRVAGDFEKLGAQPIKKLSMENYE
jgi:hypothetical protein